MSSVSQSCQRRTLRSQPSAAHLDPLASEGALPPTAATVIVKAARAYLQDPTRPVTPAESSRHLLSDTSWCGSYSNRPQTSGGWVGSQEFVKAAARDEPCWPAGNLQQGTQPDIWCRDAGTADAAEAWSSQQCSSQVPTRLTRRTTASAPALHPLPGVNRDSSTRSSARASSATINSSSRVSELGALVPLGLTRSKQAAGCRGGAFQPSDSVAIVAQGLTAGHDSCSSRPSSGSVSVPDSETACSAHAVREDSSTTCSSCLIRPSSVGECSSRGSSSSLSSRNDLQSGGTGRPCQLDELSAAEAELDQLLLEADATAYASNCQASCDIRTAGAPSGSGAASYEWQQGITRVLQRMQALSLDPADATALLQCCSELQCLLDTAADWGFVHQWLQAPAAHAAQTESNTTSFQRVGLLKAGSSTAVSTGLSAGNLLSMVLQALVRLVDSRKPDVVVKVGAMLLSLTPISSHMLLPAAKVLYSLSKDSSNDSRFRHHGVLRPLLSMIAILSSAVRQRHQQEHTNMALLYCSGCLKNISADATNQKSLGRLGGIATMAQVAFDQVDIALSVAAAMAQPQPQLAESSRHPQHQLAAQVAVQVTAVLRNLAVEAANAQYYAQQQGAALQALVSLLQPFQHHPEVLLNVSRCLSKLSLYECCRLALLLPAAQQPLGDSSSGMRTVTALPAISRPSSAGWATRCCNSRDTPGALVQPGSSPSAGLAQVLEALLRVQVAQPQQWPTAVRLVFALGQLTYYHAESRPRVAAVPGVLDALPQLVLGLVQQQQQSQPQTPQGQQAGLAEDLITKVLRVLANLSIDRTVGPALAAKQSTTDALLAIITTYDYERHEELVLNAAAVVTNLAYFDTTSNKLLQADADVLLLSLLQLLTSGNEEAMSEAARAVGNLARASPAVRAALTQANVLEQPGQAACSSSEQQVSAGPYVLQALVLLIGHSSWEVVHCAAGALVNLAALPEAGTALSRVGFAAALTQTLQRMQEVWSSSDTQQLQGEGDGAALAATVLLLHCVGNVIAASAAAVSEAILGAGGPRCADLPCNSEDLAGFKGIVGSLVANGPAFSGTHLPCSVKETAELVQARLTMLWGM